MAAVRSFWLNNKQESKSRFFKSCIFQQMWREHTLPQTLGESQSTNLKTVGTQFDRSCILSCVIDSWKALWSGCSRFHLVETPPTLNIVWLFTFLGLESTTIQQKHLSYVARCLLNSLLNHQFDDALQCMVALCGACLRTPEMFWRVNSTIEVLWYLILMFNSSFVIVEVELNRDRHLQCPNFTCTEVNNILCLVVLQCCAPTG